ncbi:MAG: NAD(P)-dependent oxidoreductase [Lentimicrobium sp.]|jgi:D-3-phosphoglycerate dehydrogenase|nr:NAD(P)-dependent oxidoreductase [Lentimicrobium sp.]
MKRQVLFIDTTHPYLSEALTSQGFECSHYSGTSRADILEMLPRFDGLVIRSKIKLDREALDCAVKTEFIARVGAGMENIDHAYAKNKGIVCLNAPEGNRDAVGEHAVGMLLSLLNHLCRVNTEVRNGTWIREGNRGTEIGGKTIAIIGFGNTGKAFAEKLSGFRANVIAFDKYKTGFSGLFVKEVQMDEVFREADVLSLHVPLTDETRQLIDKDFLNKFQKPIYLINTARGQCLNTSVLMDAIDSEKVLGAALDVLEYEKLSFENLDAVNLPEPFKRLIASEKVILSPHIAGWTHESNYKMAKILADKIQGLYGGDL